MTKTVIIGQGYVGLPLAMRAVEVGHEVVGLDTDQSRIDKLQGGSSYVEDVESRTVTDALASGRYLPSTDYSATNEFDVAVITVPTPLTEGVPDLSFVEVSGAQIAESLTSGAMVILESTTYPGTTEELLCPILEQGSGLVAGEDFFVGYSPERIDPGNPEFGFRNTPKVVSGVNATSLAAVDAFYSELVGMTVPVSGTKEAELAKLLENTFRHVNIALVNELTLFAYDLDIDVHEAIDAASTKPFGFMRFTPGPGVGGHCLPVDPSYLSWEVKRKLGRPFRFVELANDINDHMPDYVVNRLVEALNRRRKSVNGSKIVLIGLAYKKNAGDLRESPGLQLVDLLLGLGADLRAVEPVAELDRIPAGVEMVDLTRETVKESDAVVIVADHDVLDYAVLESAAYVLDARNRISGSNVETL